MTPGSDDTTGAAAAASPAQTPTHKVSIVYRDAEPPTTTWRGKTFVKDIPQEFDEANEADFALIEAARANPSFDVGGESKAEMRAQEQRAAEITTAQAELAGIDAEGEAIEVRQTQETNDLEAKHSAEREAFLGSGEARAIALRRVIRGSDGTDDQQPVDGAAPTNQPSDSTNPNAQPASVAQPAAQAPLPEASPPNSPSPAPDQNKPADPAPQAPAANQPTDPAPQTDPALQVNQ